MTQANGLLTGLLKLYSNKFFQLYTIHCEKDGYIIPYIYALLKDKREATYDRLFKQLIQIEPGLNPTQIMVDFEKATINALEENFIAVFPDASFIYPKMCFAKFNQMD